MSLNNCAIARLPMNPSLRSLMLILFILFSASLVVSFDVHAQGEHAELVKIESWLGERVDNPDKELAQTYAVNEQLILNIEVSTPRWFTGGTRIGDIEIPNVIVKQRNPLATNYTKRENGQTWSVQLWEITLYPQAAGQYQIAPIQVDTSVSGRDGKTVRTTLSTTPNEFRVTVPSQLQTLTDKKWLSASKVNIDQAWQVASGNGSQSGELSTLKVGDTITRTVKVTANDTLSVLIPPLLDTPVEGNKGSSGSNEVTISSKYHCYSQPSKLEDTQTRGHYISSREEVVTYVVQAGGEVTLSPAELYWWNTSTNQLEVMTLTGKTFNVKHTFGSFVAEYRARVLAGITIIAGLGLSIGFVARYYANRPTPLWGQFAESVVKQHWPKATGLVYRKLRRDTRLIELNQYSQNAIYQNKTWKKVSHALQNSPKQKKGSTRQKWGLQKLFFSAWRQIRKPEQQQRNFKFAIPKALPELENIRPKADASLHSNYNND